MLFLERSLHLLPSLTEHIILSLNIIIIIHYFIFVKLINSLVKKIMVRHSGTAPLASSRSVGAVFAGDFQTSRGTALAL